MKKIIIVVMLFVLICLSSLTAQSSERISYSYPEIGVTVLSPGGINLMAGYTTEWLNARIAGMYLGKTFGFQSELNFNVKNNENSRSGPGIVIGYVDASEPSANFEYTTNDEGVRGLLLGAQYSWNYHLFYISVGGAATLINANTDPPFALLFNLGINKRFLHN